MSETVDVVLIRHAQSTWNEQERFTGWSDPALTAYGIAEASRAAAKIRSMGYRFDQVYASRLQRAEHTARIILQGTHNFELKVKQDWRLNERHYGALQGKFRKDMIESVGAEQVARWRRGYRDMAEPMSRDNPAHPINDKRYSEVPRERLPDVESLADTQVRVLEFWNEVIVPHIQAGEQVMISAHGNALRGLMMSLSGMGEDEVETFDVPTGVPIIYKFSSDGTPISWQCIDLLTAA